MLTISALPAQLVLVILLVFSLVAHGLWWFLFVFFSSYLTISWHGSWAMYNAHVVFLSAVYSDNSLTASVWLRISVFLVFFFFFFHCPAPLPPIFFLVHRNCFHLSPWNQRWLSAMCVFCLSLVHLSGLVNRHMWPLEFFYDCLYYCIFCHCFVRLLCTIQWLSYYLHTRWLQPAF